MTTRGGPTPAAALFAFVALLHLVPVWSVRYVPTADGPSHTYNAWILHHLVRGDSPFLDRYFEVDRLPYANWLGHAFMAATMSLAEPLVAEKLLVSLILLLFFAGAWMLGGPTFSFLALPLSYHLLLQFGFYNYSLGVGLYAIAMAVWWRRRDSMALNAAMLLAVYFAHVVPAAMAVASIGLLWLFADRRPRHLLPPVPVVLLLSWFVTQPILHRETWTWHGALMWWPLWRVPLVMTFDVRQLWLGTFLGGLYAVLIGAALWRRRAADPFLLLTAFCVLAYLASPIGVGEGLILKARFLIFPFLVVLPFLATMAVPDRVRAGIVMVMIILSLANVVFLRHAWRRGDREIARFLEPLQRVTPRSTLLPLLFDRSVGGPVPLLSHAVDYAAIDRELVDWDNYQADPGGFPVKFRRGLLRPDIFAIEARPGTVVADADFIYAWKAPADWRPPAGYRPVVEEGEGRLYRK